MMYSYAILDSNNIAIAMVTFGMAFASPPSNYILVPDNNAIGKKYQNGSWVTVS